MGKPYSCLSTAISLNIITRINYQGGIWVIIFVYDTSTDVKAKGMVK